MNYITRQLEVFKLLASDLREFGASEREIIMFNQAINLLKFRIKHNKPKHDLIQDIKQLKLAVFKMLKSDETLTVTGFYSQNPLLKYNWLGE